MSTFVARKSGQNRFKVSEIISWENGKPKTQSVPKTSWQALGFRPEMSLEEAVRRDSRRSEEIIVSMPAKWRAGVDVKASLTNFVPQYGATVGYRAFGPVWVEASGYQDGTAVIRGVWEF